jgi:SAM domain (Sterile alpha motif)
VAVTAPEASVDIAAGLHSLGMQRYEEAFRANEIDAGVLPSLTAEDLKDLVVTLVGIAGGCLMLSRAIAA